MENPKRTLPLALNGSMMTTITSFTLVVVVFYLCLPLDVIRSKTILAGVSAPLDFRSCISIGFFVYSLILLARPGIRRVPLRTYGESLVFLCHRHFRPRGLQFKIFMSAKLCVSAGERDFLPASVVNNPSASGVFGVSSSSTSNPAFHNFFSHPSLHILRGAGKIFPMQAVTPV